MFLPILPCTLLPALSLQVGYAKMRICAYQHIACYDAGFMFVNTPWHTRSGAPTVDPELESVQ